MVELGDLDGHVEGGGVVEEFGEVDGARESLVFAGELDELDELFVEGEFATGDVGCCEFVDGEGVAEDVEEHGFACEAVCVLYE